MVIAQRPPTGDAGLVGLEHEIRNTATGELVEQYDLLSEIHPVLWDAVKPRFALVAAELDRRGWRLPIRIMTAAELKAESGA